MTYEVQVPLGQVADQVLRTVLAVHSPSGESALAYALHVTRADYNLRQFEACPSIGSSTRKYTLKGDPRVCAYVTTRVERG